MLPSLSSPEPIGYGLTQPVAGLIDANGEPGTTDEGAAALAGAPLVSAGLEAAGDASTPLAVAAGASCE